MKKISSIFKSETGKRENSFLSQKTIHDQETSFTKDESMMKIRYLTRYDKKTDCYLTVTVINDKIV